MRTARWVHLATSVLIGVSCLAQTAEQTEEVAVVLQVVPRNSAAAVEDGFLTVARVGDATLRQEVPLKSGTASIILPAATDWDVNLHANGWWAHETITVNSAQVSPISIPAWRTGVVHGRLTVADGSAMPSAARVVVESPPDHRVASEIPRNTYFDCPVDKKGVWSCSLPATMLDVAVVCKGFIPAYRWSFKVEETRANLFGEIALRRGASLVAWLDAGVIGSLDGPAKARLLRIATDDSSVTAARLAAPVAEGTFNKRGAVQLAAVPPGVYMLEVSAPGFAPSRVHPVEIHDGRESVLRRAIVLERPLTLRIAIQPPADPRNLPWSVDVRRENDFGSGFDPAPITIRRVEDSPGEFEIPDQSAGRYVLRVSDTQHQFRISRRFEVRNAIDADVSIDIPFVHVRGKVTFGREPLAARLFFGGRSGSERVTIETDGNGAFEGGLSRAGEWVVDVDAIDNSMSGSVDAVISEQDDEVTIDLPDTTIAGHVVDSSGGRAGLTSVTLLAGQKVVRARTNSDATFLFRGVPTGPVTLLARDLRTGETSQPLALTLVDGVARDVELRIESQRNLIGTVVSGGSSVAGALVSAYPMTDGPWEQIRAISDAQGQFRVRLPLSTRRALVAVGTAGHVFQSFDIAIGEAPAVLDLSTVGGTVRLLLPPTARDFALTRNGVLLPNIDLFQWVAAQGQYDAATGTMTIPSVATGTYQACVPAGGRCVQRQLAPNATVELDLR